MRESNIIKHQYWSLMIFCSSSYDEVNISIGTCDRASAACSTRTAMLPLHIISYHYEEREEKKKSKQMQFKWKSSQLSFHSSRDGNEELEVATREREVTDSGRHRLVKLH